MAHAAERTFHAEVAMLDGDGRHAGNAVDVAAEQRESCVDAL